MKKMKRNSISNEMVKIYKAYFNKGDTLIATSENKNILKDYMEKRRLLNRQEYYIEKELIGEAYYYIQYEDFILTEYLDRIISYRDIQIIESEYSNLKDEIESTINKLKYLSFLTNRTKKIKKNTKDFINIINILDEFKNKSNIYNKIEETHYKNHPIFECKIEEYLDMIKRHNELKEMQRKYKMYCDIE